MVRILYFKPLKLEENKNDSKSLWRILKNLGLPSKQAMSSSSGNLCLNINGSICFDKETIANSFNTFYTNVASMLVKKLPPSVNRFGKSFVPMGDSVCIAFDGIEVIKDLDLSIHVWALWDEAF